MVGEVKHHVPARLVKKWLCSVRLSPENVVARHVKKKLGNVMRRLDSLKKRFAIVMKRLGNAMKKLDNVIKTSVQPNVGAGNETRTTIAAVLRMLEALLLRH
jgi:hypothetical protein